MSIVDKAWNILTKVGPFKELDDFVQKLRPTFQEFEHLSPDEARAKKAEIKKKMLERIKSDKQTFGEALAEGADYVLENQPSIEEECEVVECYDQYGAEGVIEKYGGVMEGVIEGEPEPKVKVKDKDLRQQEKLIDE